MLILVMSVLHRKGYYSNRTDFIRTAVRNQADRRHNSVKQSVTATNLSSGSDTTPAKTWKLFAANTRRFTFRFSDSATIADDVSPELAFEQLRQCTSLEHCTPAPQFKTALSDRIR